MGQFFSNKYVVVYGFSSAIAGAENIADLQTPKCIGRIHLYSDMWKYFDRGLHKFLVRQVERLHILKVPSIDSDITERDISDTFISR